VVERLAIRSRSETIGREDLGTVRREPRGERPAAVALPETGISLEEVERRLVIEALERTDWSQKKAADLLGISVDRMNARVRSSASRTLPGGFIGRNRFDPAADRAVLRAVVYLILIAIIVIQIHFLNAVLGEDVSQKRNLKTPSRKDAKKEIENIDGLRINGIGIQNLVHPVIPSGLFAFSSCVFAPCVSIFCFSAFVTL